MRESAESFYDELAESYHLMFQDWNRSIARQASVLGPLLERFTGKASPYVLDCACGIGTQTIGLAKRGHVLVGSDLSASSIARAKAEARLRNLDVPFHVADMRSLSTLPETGFDAVLIGDNALPHLLSQGDLEHAAVQIASKLKDFGILLATVRDYDGLVATRPTIHAPAFFETGGKSRIVHQVWQWEGEQYKLHLYLTLQIDSGWQVKHFVSKYRALRRSDLEQALHAAKFSKVLWLEPDATSFYQPIAIGVKGGAAAE